MSNRIGILIFNYLFVILTSNSSAGLPPLLLLEKGKAKHSVSSISVGSADTITLHYQGLSCAHRVSCILDVSEYASAAYDF